MDGVAKECVDDIQFVQQGRDDFFISACKTSALEGAGVQENSTGSLFCSTGIQFATCNSVMGNDAPSDGDIDAAVHYFKERALPFIWWSDSKILERKGFQFGGQLTGVVASLDTIQQREFPEIRVVPVTDRESLKTFSEILVQGSGMPAKIEKQVYSLFLQNITCGRPCHFLAYYNDVPAGTITLSLSHKTSGLWNLVTLIDFRRKGVGTALTLTALDHARKRGHKKVMAILMPKGLAWNLMMQLGFERVCQFPFYIYGTAADELEQ